MNKNNLSCLLIGFVLCASLSAQPRQEASRAVVPDSTFTFYYPSCIQMFKADYKTNRQTLRLLKQQLRTFAKGKDTLYVNGYSGECDNDRRNLRTAYYRCNNLKGYLINFYGLRERDFKTVNIPHNHPDLGDILIISLSAPSPSGQQAEEAILKEEPGKKIPVRADDRAVQKEEEQLKRYRPEQKLPEQERPEQSQSEQPTAPSPRHEPSEAAPFSEHPGQASAESTESIESAASPLSPPRYISVKTNLAAWAGTILNMAADVQVARHISVELPVLWCPWYIAEKHAVKTFTLQPEGRYWLTRPGEGHFFGIHAHVGWYSAKWDRDRYQDTDRPLYGAGVSYGYLLPFNAHWAGEFTVGAGYANMKYDRFYNIENGARIDTATKSYWGVTRVGLSVVYRFNAAK